MLKGERTRQRIIKKAAPLFNQHGFSGCSMQDVSVATGLEKGSLYAHFANKEELAVAAFDYAWQQTGSARVGNLDEINNSVDKLKLHIENFVSKPSFSGGCPMLNTILDSDDGNPALRHRAEAALEEWAGFLADIIRTGQTKGEIRSSVHPEDLAVLLISLLEGAFISSKLQRSRRALALAQQHLIAHLEDQVRASTHTRKHSVVA
jgi:TetR/AcrR family transcriptional regulator, transcriptional repressor for nem operon